MLILPDINAQESILIADNLRHEIARAAWGSNIPGGITASVGIATFAGTGNETTLLRQADQALYTSKEQGRNRVTHCMDSSALPW